MRKIAIVLEGGLVQNVITEEPAEIIVIDYDTEGAGNDEITSMFGNDAIIRQFDSEHNSVELQEIIKKMNEGDSK